MAIPLTKREKIVGRANVRFAGIRADLEPEVYNTNVGKNVFYWRTGMFSEEEIEGMDGEAALVIRDIDETKQVLGDTNRINIKTGQPIERELHFQLEIVKLGTLSPDTIHKIIADIETAIRKDIRWRDEDGKPLAIGTRPRIDRSVVEQESRKVSGVVYEFFVHYITEAFNAYQ